MIGTVARNRAFSLSAMLIAAVGLVAASAVARTPNPQTVYSGPGRYEIENVASGKVLDLNRQDQRTVVQWPRTHAQSQLWDIVDAGNGYVYIKSAVTGLVMDIDGGRARDGARVITSQPSGSDSQLWKVEGHGSASLWICPMGRTMTASNTKPGAGPARIIRDSALCGSAVRLPQTRTTMAPIAR